MKESLREKIYKIAKKQFKENTVKCWLKLQHYEKKLDVEEIAKRLKTKPHYVERLMNTEKIKIRKNKSFVAQIKKLRYKSIDDFFMKNEKTQMKDMASELGVAFGTIRYQYTKWLKSRFNF